MGYTIVTLVSIVATFMNFAAEIVTGNLVHVQNGREPNARAALFPGIPFVPLFAIAFAWVLNQLHAQLGAIVITGLFLIWLPFWYCSMKKANAELKALLAEAVTPEQIGPQISN